MTTTNAKQYTAKDIQVLEGLEPVRKRPGMYIGGVSSAGLHHLVWEVLDNAIDEAMNGHASEVRLKGRDAWQTLESDRKAKKTLTLELPVVQPDVTVPVIELFLK